jgi:hypothetical protein
MRNNTSFIEELLQKVPPLKNIYDEHLNENDTLLPHVFMGDVTRFVIAEAANPKRQETITSLLEYLEEGIQTGSDEVRELILVSFVENLTGETKMLQLLKALMGQTLRSEVKRICE